MPQVRDITLSNDGIIWIGTLGYGLSKLYDTGIWFGTLRSDTKTSTAIISTSTRALYPLNAHEILIGGYGGLEIYDFNLMQTRALLGDDSGNKMYVPFSIIADQAQNSVIWIGTEGEGLIRMDLSSMSYQVFIQRNGHYESNIINDLQWISETRLMIGTTAGLRIFDTET